MKENPITAKIKKEIIAAAIISIEIVHISLIIKTNDTLYSKVRHLNYKDTKKFF